MVTATREADDLELIRELLEDPFSTNAEVELTSRIRRLTKEDDRVEPIDLVRTLPHQRIGT